MRRRRAITSVGWLLGMAVAAVAATGVEISPENPTERDVITLKVQQSFTEDCRWQVKPKVRREGRKIEVKLEVKGSAGCDQALTDRTFEVPIGPFPAGEYVLWVCWSDGETVGSRPLKVVPASRKRK